MGTAGPTGAAAAAPSAPVAGPWPRRPGGPTVVRMVLGHQLRRIREAAGVSREAAGYEIRASESKISRLECGRVGVKARDVSDLLTLYGVTGAEQREALLSLVTEANAPGWWQQFGDVLPTWREAYLGLEEAAARIRVYSPQAVPELLQTEDYARALIRLGAPDATSGEIERMVRLRLTRQRLLDRDDPPAVWVVVDESALLRPIGGARVMRGQVEHLLEIVDHPAVSLYVVPLSVPAHPGAGVPFTILRFTEPELPDVVYLEQLTSALYLDGREELDRYSEVFDRLGVYAGTGAQTPGRLRRALRHFA